MSEENTNDIEDVTELEIEQDQDEETENETGEESEAESTEQDQDGEKSEDQDEEELVLTIDDKPIDQEREDDSKAPDWVRELRKTNREQAKKLKEYEAKLAESAPKRVEQEATLPPKPRLEDFDYDSDVFAEKVEEWTRLKLAHDEKQSEKERQAKEHQQAWQAKIEKYEKAKTDLRIRDYDDAETEVQRELNETQLGIIVEVSENPAIVTYALGKSPEKLKALSAIKNPVQFIYALAKFEQKELKVTKSTKKPPAPEKMPASGGGGISGAVDSTLERLREKARKTGDFSEVHAYKKRKGLK